MGQFGIFDPDDAVREGWARDPENEVSFDGYSAFLQITTSDGSSGFSITNSTGATTFKAKSDGDGYVAKNLGVGKFNPTETLDVAGTAKVEGFQLTTAPSSGYVLTSDGTGVGTWQIPGDIGDVILDGYLTEEEHRNLDQLVHNIAETSFEEITYNGSKPTNITIWTDAGKTLKIREEQFTYSNNQVSQIVVVQYDEFGTVVETLTESLTYSGGKITSISRTLT